jgi:hypothetical protein
MASPMKMRRDTVLTTTDTEAQTKTCPGDLVPRHRTLDGFIAAVSQADGIDTGGADQQLGLPDHDSHTTHSRGLGPGW